MPKNTSNNKNTTETTLDTNVLPRKYTDVLEALGWTATDAGDGTVEVEKYSPAGEDFSFSVCTEDFTRQISRYADDFDVEDHIAMWISAAHHGTRGVPSASVLVKDAQEIKKMLTELCDALEKADALDACVEHNLCCANPCGYPCYNCRCAVVNGGITFSCPSKVAMAMISDAKTGRFSNEEEEAAATEYYVLAQTGDGRKMTAALSVLKPDNCMFLDTEYDMHIIDDITGADCRLETVENLTEYEIVSCLQAATSKLAEEEEEPFGEGEPATEVEPSAMSIDAMRRAIIALTEFFIEDYKEAGLSAGEIRCGLSSILSAGNLKWLGIEVPEHSRTTQNYVQTLTIPIREAEKYNAMMRASSLDYNALGIRTCSTVKSWTVDYLGDGYEADLKVCSGDWNSPLWCEVVLFKDGCECCCSIAKDNLLGDWILKDKNNIYVIRVIAKD